MKTGNTTVFNKTVTTAVNTNKEAITRKCAQAPKDAASTSVLVFGVLLKDSLASKLRGHSGDHLSYTGPNTWGKGGGGW